MAPLARLAFPHLKAVAISAWRRFGSIIAVAISHGITVLHDYGEFLINKIKTIIAVPPGTASIELGGITTLLVMHAKTVGIFTIALATIRVIVVVRVAVQKVMTAAVSTPVVDKESRTTVVVTINLFQEDMLAIKNIN